MDTINVLPIGPDEPAPAFEESEGELEGISDSEKKQSLGSFEKESDLLELPTAKVWKEPTWKASFMTCLYSSYFNWLILIVVASWGLHFAGIHYLYSNLATSVVGIIPLSRLSGYTADQLALRMPRRLGRLFCCTIGNLVELVIAVVAVVYCDLKLASSCLIGSILSNCLLVLGACMFAGGLKHSQIHFNRHSMQALSTLLVISIIAISIPAAFDAAFHLTVEVTMEAREILYMSRGTAVALLIVYFASLFFQLHSHSRLYDEPTEHMLPSRDDSSESSIGMDGDRERPEMNLGFSLLMLFLTTGFLVVSALALVLLVIILSIERQDISGEWFGLILIPVVTNAAEQIPSITSSYEGKVEEALYLALGKSIQLALCFIPIIIMVAWGLNKPMNLLFDPFESIILVLTIFVVTYTLQGASSNWLSGFMLMAIYGIIAFAFWFYLPSADSLLEAALSRLIAVVAVVYCDLKLASSCLIGSILSNCLLVLGACMFAGGLKHSQIHFNRHSMQALSTLLIISIIFISIPAAFDAAFHLTVEVTMEAHEILYMSRGTAVALLIVYFASLPNFNQDSVAQYWRERRRG